MPTRNVKVGSGLGVDAGAGVAAGVGTGIAVSAFLTRRPDCAEIASEQITTSAIVRLTLTVFENCRRCIDFFSVNQRESMRRYMHLQRRENFVSYRPRGFYDFTVAVGGS